MNKLEKRYVSNILITQGFVYNTIRNKLMWFSINNFNLLTTHKVGSGGRIAPVLFFEYAGAFFN